MINIGLSKLSYVVECVVVVALIVWFGSRPVLINNNHIVLQSDVN